MKVSQYKEEYRKKLEEDAAKEPAFRDFLNSVLPESAENLESIPDDVGDAVGIIKDSHQDTDVRITALRGISYEIGEDEGLIVFMLELLGDPGQPNDLRKAVLVVLQQLGFSSALFRSKHSAYTEILRSILGEESSGLRLEAMEVLSREKDEYLQRLLIAGLRGEAEALVVPEKAIQLLSYDIHAEIFPILREIVNNPPNPVAKNEAMRILAADSDSKDLIKTALLDKEEDRFVRQTSAAALKSLAPEEFEEAARDIVGDDTDYDEIRASAITALEFSPAPASGPGLESMDELAPPPDDSLTDKVGELSGSSSGELKKAAERFLASREKNK